MNVSSSFTAETLWTVVVGVTVRVRVFYKATLCAIKWFCFAFYNRVFAFLYRVPVTMPCHYYETLIGCQWNSELSSKLLFLSGNVFTALLSLPARAMYSSGEHPWSSQTTICASSGCIKLPRVKTSLAQRSFAYNGPPALNCLQCHKHSSGD